MCYLRPFGWGKNFAQNRFSTKLEREDEVVAVYCQSPETSSPSHLNGYRTKKMAEKKITEATVLTLFREDKISTSKGAQLLGIPIQDFMDLLNANGIPLWDGTPEELKEDVKALRELRKKYKKKEQAI